MPEGPSIILVKEALSKFAGKKIIAVSGNSKIDQRLLLNKKIIEFKSWGNEILYRVRLHPESVIEKIKPAKLNKLIDETRIYSFQFLEWKRTYELKKHWLAHTKKICLRCNLPIIKKQTGLKKRRSCICVSCQTLYS